MGVDALLLVRVSERATNTIWFARTSKLCSHAVELGRKRGLGGVGVASRVVEERHRGTLSSAKRRESISPCPLPQTVAHTPLTPPTGVTRAAAFVAAADVCASGSAAAVEALVAGGAAAGASMYGAGRVLGVAGGPSSMGIVAESTLSCSARAWCRPVARWLRGRAGRADTAVKTQKGRRSSTSQF